MIHYFSLQSDILSVYLFIEIYSLRNTTAEHAKQTAVNKFILMFRFLHFQRILHNFLFRIERSC